MKGHNVRFLLPNIQILMVIYSQSYRSFLSNVLRIRTIQFKWFFKVIIETMKI